MGDNVHAIGIDVPQRTLWALPSLAPNVRFLAVPCHQGSDQTTVPQTDKVGAGCPSSSLYGRTCRQMSPQKWASFELPTRLACIGHRHTLNIGLPEDNTGQLTSYRPLSETTFFADLCIISATAANDHYEGSLSGDHL